MGEGEDNDDNDTTIEKDFTAESKSKSHLEQTPNRITNRISGNIEIHVGSKGDFASLKNSMEMKTVKVDTENIVEIGGENDGQTDEPHLTAVATKTETFDNKSPEVTQEGD